MATKDLRSLGATQYRIRQVRQLQKDLPDINNLIWETSTEEVTQYELGGLSDEDIITEFKHQTQFDNINDFLKSRLNQIKMEKETVEMTGRTLNFIENLADYQAALPDYTTDEIMAMSKQERIEALYDAYYEQYGSYPHDSDETYLLNSLTRET